MQLKTSCESLLNILGFKLQLKTDIVFDFSLRMELGVGQRIDTWVN